MSWAIFLGIVTVSLSSAIFKLEEENCFLCENLDNLEKLFVSQCIQL